MDCTWSIIWGRRAALAIAKAASSSGAGSAPERRSLSAQTMDFKVSMAWAIVSTTDGLNRSGASQSSLSSASNAADICAIPSNPAIAAKAVSGRTTLNNS